MPIPDIAVSQEEIDKVLNAVANQIDEGGSRFPGMTYEEGVREAIYWILGNTEENPYPER